MQVNSSILSSRRAVERSRLSKHVEKGNDLFLADCNTAVRRWRRRKERKKALLRAVHSQTLVIQTTRSVAIDYVRFIHENVAHLLRFESSL